MKNNVRVKLFVHNGTDTVVSMQTDIDEWFSKNTNIEIISTRSTQSERVDLALTVMVTYRDLSVIG